MNKRKLQIEKQRKEKEKSVTREYLILKACFRGFIIGNTTNILSLFWTSGGGIELRIIINYIIWPLFGLLFGGSIFKGIEYNKIIIKNKLIIDVIIIFILILCASGAALNIQYEHEKEYCKMEKTMGNYFNCIDEANKNSLHFSKFFDEKKYQN